MFANLKGENERALVILHFFTSREFEYLKYIYVYLYTYIYIYNQSHVSSLVTYLFMSSLSITLKSFIFPLIAKSPYLYDVNPSSHML